MVIYKEEEGGRFRVRKTQHGPFPMAS